MNTYLEFLAAFGVGGAHPGGLALTKEVLQTINPSPEAHILDAGCGTGQTAAFIAKHYNCQVTALDENSIMLTKLKKRMEREGITLKETIQGSIEALPFKSKTFDFILSESVTSFTHIPRSLKEYRRVLKDGGVLVAIEMTKMQELEVQELLEINKFYGFKALLSEEEWKKEILECGFTKVDIKDIPMSTSEDPHTEFDLSNNISNATFKIMEQHQNFLEIYKEKIGSKIYYSY